jgi:AcrR family transcriptional regulator
VNRRKHLKIQVANFPVALVPLRRDDLREMQSRQHAGGSGVRSVRDGEDRDGLIAEIQRGRLLGATVEAATILGAGRATVSDIVERAGVSRRTFYELFRDRDECLSATFDDALARVSARVIPAYNAGGRWSGQVRAGLVDLLGFCDEDVRLARFLIVESLADGRRIVERRAEVVKRLSDAIDADGRAAGGARTHRSPIIGEGVVGAVLAVLYARLSEPPSQPLSGLASQLTSMVVLPYLGSAMAQRELLRPSPSGRVKPAGQPPSDPLKGLPMRLTYRTMRVLEAIAALPGCSNREVAQAAGITDQGQVSKLLRRLELLRLIENDLSNSKQGLANVWRLTEKGAQFRAVVEPRSGGSRNGTHG